MAETNVFGTEARACQRCKGTGTVTYAGFTTAEGTVYPEVSRTCLDCDGGGTWPVPDLGDILRRITAHKGKGKGRMRASMSSFDRTDRSVARKYAYYVWRWARFHGGADVTMPVMADKSIVRGGGEGDRRP